MTCLHEEFICYYLVILIFMYILVKIHCCIIDTCASVCDYAPKYIFFVLEGIFKTKFDYSCGRERQGGRQEEWLLGKEKYITKT